MSSNPSLGYMNKDDMQDYAVRTFRDSKHLKRFLGIGNLNNFVVALSTQSVYDAAWNIIVKACPEDRNIIPLPLKITKAALQKEIENAGGKFDGTPKVNESLMIMAEAALIGLAFIVNSFTLANYYENLKNEP